MLIETIPLTVNLTTIVVNYLLATGGIEVKPVVPLVIGIISIFYIRLEPASMYPTGGIVFSAIVYCILPGFGIIWVSHFTSFIYPTILHQAIFIKDILYRTNLIQFSLLSGLTNGLTVRAKVIPGHISVCVLGLKILPGVCCHNTISIYIVEVSIIIHEGVLYHSPIFSKPVPKIS